MIFRLTVFNSVTLSVLLLTLAMIWARFRFDQENTWLLFYYAAIGAYTMTYWDTLHPAWVILGVVIALLLRFEFMGSWVLQAVRGVELVFFGYVICRCVILLGIWPRWLT